MAGIWSRLFETKPREPVGEDHQPAHLHRSSLRHHLYMKKAGIALSGGGAPRRFGGLLRFAIFMQSQTEE